MIRSTGCRRPMDLSDLLERQFFPLSTRITNERTRLHYRRAVRWLGEALHRPAKVSDLTNDHIAAMLTYLRVERGQQATTANGSHKCLCALWRWCRDEGLIQTVPRVQALKTPIRTPRAWTISELERLVEAADASPGSIGDMPARQWWLTLIALVMDTGARSTELLALRWEWIDWDSGWLRVPAECRKGSHHDATYGLRAQTMRWLASIRKPTGEILGWNGRSVALYHKRWKELLERAGLPSGRAYQAQMLRRTFATLLTAAGGDATEALGHASRLTTLRHYLDPSATAKRHADVIPFHPLRNIGG